MTGATTTPVRIARGEENVTLDADLTVPEGSSSVVVFAHGSGSGRHSPRNRHVAEALQERGMATLLMDLLTPAEEDVDLRTRHLRFDIDLLATRMVDATTWVRDQEGLRDFSIGYFGASTGAAAALVAAAASPRDVDAVVSRGGRPDLAGEKLADVRAPTLLIVGGADDVVIGMNEQAAELLRVENRLEIVPGATHLFEEPGALDEVVRLAGDWFVDHLTKDHPTKE